MSIVTIPQGVVKVLFTGSARKILKNLQKESIILITVQATGTAAPSEATISSEGYQIFVDNPITEDLEFEDEMDVYGYCPSGTARIRVEENSSNNVLLVDETGVGYGVKQINGKPRVSSMPYLYDIAEENVEGHVAFSKIGYAPAMVANTNTDIWSYSATQPVYLFPTVAMGMEVVGSDNTDDIGVAIKTGTSTGGTTTTLIDTGANFTAATAVAIGDCVILDKAGANPEYGFVTAVTSATTLTLAGGFSRGGSGSIRGYHVVDTSAKAGAQAVEINFLDGSYAEQREIVILNGTTVVPTVKLTLFRVNSFKIITTGSNKMPTGNLFLRHIDNTPVYSYITAGFNRARNAMYTVPAGKTLYVTDLNVGYGMTGKAELQYARITSRANIDPMTKFATDGLFYPFTDVLSSVGHVNTVLSIPTRLPQKTDIKLSVIASNTGVVATALRGWIEDN